MMALFFLMLILALVVLLVRLLLSPPFLRTMSVAIDSWADSVQGEDARELL